MNDPQYRLDDLLTLMARLRDPEDGCPWDRKQSFASIVPHTLEETYEVVDAIEREDWPHLSEELGDLLFQVVFYAQLGQESGHFDFSAVVDGIVRKLLRRHPHVFPEGTLESRLPPGESLSEARIAENWERIKAEEKAEQAKLGRSAKPAGILDDVPKTIPALQRAEKLQKKAARVGFDWPDIAPVFAKLREELDELEFEVRQEQIAPERLRDEMGDVLFCAVNLARNLGVDSDEAMRGANAKFERRFGYIEQALKRSGKTPGDSSLEDMDALWDEAKKAGL